MPLSCSRFTHYWTAAAAPAFFAALEKLIKTTLCHSSRVYTEARLMVCVAKNALYIHLWLKALPSLTRVFYRTTHNKVFLLSTSQRVQTDQASYRSSIHTEIKNFRQLCFHTACIMYRNISAVNFCRRIAIKQRKLTRTTRKPCLQTCHRAELLWQPFLYMRENVFDTTTARTPLNYTSAASPAH